MVNLGIEGLEHSIRAINGRLLLIERGYASEDASEDTSNPMVGRRILVLPQWPSLSTATVAQAFQCLQVFEHPDGAWAGDELDFDKWEQGFTALAELNGELLAFERLSLVPSEDEDAPKVYRNKLHAFTGL